MISMRGFPFYSFCSRVDNDREATDLNFKHESTDDTFPYREGVLGLWLRHPKREHGHGTFCRWSFVGALRKVFEIYKCQAAFSPRTVKGFHQATSLCIKTICDFDSGAVLRWIWTTRTRGALPKCPPALHTKEPVMYPADYHAVRRSTVIFQRHAQKRVFQ